VNSILENLSNGDKYNIYAELPSSTRKNEGHVTIEMRDKCVNRNVTLKSDNVLPNDLKKQ